MTGSLVVVAFGVGYLAGRLRGRMLERDHDGDVFTAGWNAAVTTAAMSNNPLTGCDMYEEPETWGRA